MATPFYQISGDARRALEEFSTEFTAALVASPAEQWARSYGLYKASNAIKTTYPIPISAAGYVERRGDDKMRGLYERSVSVKPIEWVDGVSELARIIKAPDFIGWGEEPARIAIEAARQPNRLVAALLEANSNMGFYRDENLGTDLGIPFFAATHPVNIFDASRGTFSNDTTAVAIDGTMIAAALTRFRAKKAPNGKPMGLKITDMFVPGALEQQAKDLLESDLLINAVLASGSNTQQTSNNRYKGVVNLQVCDELTAANVIYMLDRSGPKPWILQDGGAPEQITFDENDAMYKTTGRVGMKFILTMAAAASLPHAIERITITG